MKMFALYIFTTLLFISNAEETSESYCDIAENKCTEINNSEKFLFYDVNPPEGFNLRRDVYMRYAIMLSELQKRGKRKNWRLVLPPWYKLYHWKSETNIAHQIFWNAFFNIESMKNFAPVVEIHDVFSKLNAKAFKMDRVYVLQNYADPFENGVFEEKWEVNNDCKYSTDFWGYKNITANEVICIYFQGKVSKLWEVISLHPTDKYVMFLHGEIPLHDNYGSKIYWDCRKSMKFNKNLIKTANNYILKYFQCDNAKCSTYLSIHWRRQDFAKSRKNDVPSLEGTVKQIHKAIKTNRLNIKKVFIATDASNSEIKKLESYLIASGYEPYTYVPSALDIKKYKDGGVAIIEQIISSHAAYFIGTHESTFTFRIQEEREILGFDSGTTFNRFCPDKGQCEKPSKWTIVN